MILLNGHAVDIGKFPNGEQNISLESLTVRALNKVEWLYEGDEEFVALAILKGHLTAIGHHAWLKVHYMPHSRMDRANNDYAFSLRYITSMINAMGWVSIDVTEPHSDVTPALLSDCVVTEWCQSKIADVVVLSDANTVFFPDAGAQKRYKTYLPSAVGIKQRDFKSGNITSFDLHGKVGNRVLIVDDLSSKGGTFIHSAILLKKMGASSVSLLVAHCEQTVFTGELFEHIDMMYTSPSNLLKDHEQITTI